MRDISAASIIASLLFSLPAAAGAMVLASAGATNYSIVVSANAVASEKTAARELASYLKRVTGARLAIRLESDVDASAPQILVGQSDRLKALAPDIDWSALGRDGIVIRTVGNKLLLAGGQPRGTLYAVYTFLEDTVGCRWWTSTESFVPQKPTLQIPPLNITYAPRIIYREAFYRDPIENPEFAAKLKLNGHFYNIPDSFGGHYEIIGWCHTFYALLPPDKYFDKHPEWYSEINGKRTPSGGQLCLTNEEMRAELTRRALEEIEKKPNAGIISISQNDWQGACQCAKCAAIDKEEGSHAGTLIRFVNAVAEEIEKVHPDVLVETLAYQYTRKPPLNVRPRHNVVVRLCSIECDFLRPLESPANQAFRDDIRGWSAIAPNLYVWDYVTDFASYIQPHPNMRVLAPNLRFFEKNNVIGVFEQGDRATSIGDFVRLRTWVLAHLEWDPSRDEKKLISEFLHGYYGPAAPYLQSYLDLVHDAAEKTGMHLSCYNSDLSFLTLPLMNRATELFDQAAEAVAGNSVLSRRVRRERIPLDHVWLLRYDELKRQAEMSNLPFGGPEDGRAACKEFIKLAHEWDVRNYSEARSFDSYIPSLEARFAPPAPKPEEFAKLPPEDMVDIQNAMFTLFDPPRLCKIVDDPKASDSKAAMMDGSHIEWAVQYHVQQDLADACPGRWKWYAIIRTEGDKTGGAFRYGIYDGKQHREIVNMVAGLEVGQDGEYHTYYFGNHEVESGMYLWIAPLGNAPTVQGIYIDRVILVRDREE